jgi:glycosyltransferase involved in cell wall biosynthesis
MYFNVKGGDNMAVFRFKFVLDKFQKTGAIGPILTPNVRAKWLTRLCPGDLEIAFAPSPGQKPMYDADKIKLINKYETGWWNHYFFLREKLPVNEAGWSLGPNIHLPNKIKEKIPLVANSKFHKYERIMKQWNYLENKIFVIPNIIDPELFHPGKRNKNITVGWIGYDVDIRNVKGVEVIPYLAKKFPEIQFEMVFAVKPRIIKKWLKEELPNLKIMFEIPHNKMPEVIRKWHVLVSGTKSETGATHIKEAMACGVPVIAAAVGAVPEVASSQMLLTHMSLGNSKKGEDIYNWSKESLERFASALYNLLTDRQKYNQLVAGAIQESKNAHPNLICQKWFHFMYYCRDY